MAVCLDYQSVYCPRDRVVVSTRVLVLLTVLLLVALGIKVWISIESRTIGYRLAEARQYTVDLDMERRELTLQKSVLTRPDQLKRAAQDRLGLKEAQAGQIIRLKVGG